LPNPLAGRTGASVAYTFVKKFFKNPISILSSLTVVCNVSLVGGGNDADGDVVSWGTERNGRRFGRRFR
jgi:hypothetical protein